MMLMSIMILSYNAQCMMSRKAKREQSRERIRRRNSDEDNSRSNAQWYVKPSTSRNDPLREKLMKELNKKISSRIFDDIQRYVYNTPGQIMPFINPKNYRERQYQFREYAYHNFNNIKGSTLAALRSYSEAPLKNSLTKLNNNKLSKKAIQCFNWILDYMKKGNVESIDKIVDTLYSYPALYDEVYCQVMKQTNIDKTSPKHPESAWEIFLVLTSIFPSSKEFKPFVLAYLGEFQTNSNENVESLAQLCYIRFSVRCDKGLVNVKKFDSEQSVSGQILDQYKKGICDYFASAYEHFWFQRDIKKELTVPVILEKLTSQIIEKVDTKKEDIFGIVHENNNQIALEKFLKRYDSYRIGKWDFSDFTAGELMYIFRMWFSGNEYKLITDDLFYLMDDDHDQLEIYDKMNEMNRYILAFLVGFCRKLCKYNNNDKDKFKEFIKSLAYSFGMAIVDEDVNAAQPDFYNKVGTPAIILLEYLIQEWKVDDYY